MEERKTGLNSDLQAVVDTLAAGGYEVFGIDFEGFVNAKKDRPAYHVVVSKAEAKDE